MRELLDKLLAMRDSQHLSGEEDCESINKWLESSPLNPLVFLVLDPHSICHLLLSAYKCGKQESAAAQEIEELKRIKKL